MLRRIGAVIAGYVVMAMVVFLLFSAAFVALGTELSFRPGSFETSGLWAVVSIAVSLLAAVAGGYVCAAIAREPKAVVWLIVLLVVLGVISAALEMQKPEPGPRTGDLANLEAAAQARQPLWLAWLLPLLGAAGVWYGGRLRLRAPAGA